MENPPKNQIGDHPHIEIVGEANTHTRPTSDRRDTVFTPLTVSARQIGDHDIRAAEKCLIDFLNRWRLAVQSMVPLVELDFELCSVVVNSYDHYVRSGADIADINVYSLAQDDTEFGFVYDRKLVLNLVNFIFGGSEEQEEESAHRRLTAMDQGITRRLFSLMAISFEGGFAALYPQVRVEEKRSERRISHLRIAHAAEDIVVAKIIFRMRSKESWGDLLIPRRVLRGIISENLSGAKVTENQSAANAENKLPPISEKKKIRAIFSDIDISLEQLNNLCVGSTIPIGSINDNSVTVQIDGHADQYATAGLIKSEYAIRLKENSSTVKTTNTPDDGNE
jgi:flagellar motor switch protein FliM